MYFKKNKINMDKSYIDGLIEGLMKQNMKGFNQVLYGLEGHLEDNSKTKAGYTTQAHWQMAANELGKKVYQTTAFNTTYLLLFEGVKEEYIYYVDKYCIGGEDNEHSTPMSFNDWVNEYFNVFEPREFHLTFLMFGED